MKKNQPLNIKDFSILYDNILCKSIVITEKKGVIIPKTYETKPELGEVISVGSGRVFENGETRPLLVKIGDIVYFNKYTTTKFNVDGDEYYVLKEEDVVGYKR